MEEADWLVLRSRKKRLRFSQYFLIDLVKKYGNLPEGTSVRDVYVNFDTGDIVYSCLNVNWPEVQEGEVSEIVDIDFDLPVLTETGKGTV